MKIGIYGDSFGCINTKWELESLGIGPSWVDLLELQHTITNYSSSGTAFMFSYELFLNNYKNNDLNIIVVTNPSRIYVKALDGMHMFGISWLDDQYAKVKKMPLYEKKYEHLEILKSLRVYMTTWVDWKMVRHTQHALINNLWNLAPNTIVIPAFSDSIEQTEINLQDISIEELRLVDENESKNYDMGNLDCRRKCHLSVENNEILANKIISAINDGSKIIEFAKSETAVPKASKDIRYYVKHHTP